MAVATWLAPYDRSANRKIKTCGVFETGRLTAAEGARQPLTVWSGSDRSYAVFRLYQELVTCMRTPFPVRCFAIAVDNDGDGRDQATCHEVR